MGFDKSELLRQTGYTEGDILQLVALGPVSSQASSTTSTSFSDVGALGRFFLRWDRLTPETGGLQARLSGRFVPGTGETMAVRYRSLSAGETVVEETGISSAQNVDTGWVDYSPSNPSAVEEIKFEHKTDSGNNSSTSNSPLLHLGVKL